MIKIVTDSTAYLPADYVHEHDIHVVPLLVHFGEDVYKEGVELSTAEFYEKLRAADELPTTSQPSAGEFHEVFGPLIEAGHEILALTISAKLSGTWNSAKAAQAMLSDAPISVIDSLSTSVGLQLMIETAVSAISSGATRGEIVERIEKMKGQIQVLFVVDTLEYLAKGGRIGNARAFLGTMLKIKPILCLNDGAIEPLEQVRSKRKAVARMLELIEEGLDGNGAEARLGITHALVPDEAEAVKRKLEVQLGCPEPFVSGLGPVIGTHTGPGVVGVAACR
jgi:DegV family protein with EDD domain